MATHEKVRRGSFPLFLCQGCCPCYLSPIKLREKLKSRRLSMPNLQNRHRAMSRRWRIYYFRKGKHGHRLPHPPPRTISPSSGQHIGFGGVICHDETFSNTTRMPLMPDTDEVSHWLSRCSRWMLLYHSRARDFPKPIIFEFNHLNKKSTWKRYESNSDLSYNNRWGKSGRGFRELSWDLFNARLKAIITIRSRLTYDYHNDSLIRWSNDDSSMHPTKSYLKRYMKSFRIMIICHLRKGGINKYSI